MLPSFRLIAATFLCGFVVVFAGLRVAASLNDIHMALPVMTAQAAPAPIESRADPNMRRGPSTVPVMYDLRFVPSSATLTPILARLTPPPERIAPIQPPIVIMPPAVMSSEPAQSVEKPAETIAAVQPATMIDAPAMRPQPAAVVPVEPAKAEPLQPETPAVAAIAPQSEPEAEAKPLSAYDIPFIEPAEVDLAPLVAAVKPAEAAAETKATAVEPATTPDAGLPIVQSADIAAPETPHDAIDLGTPSALVTSPPLPKAKPALRMRAKPAPQKAAARRARTATRRTQPTGNFGDPFAAFGNQPFSYPKSSFGASN